MAVRRCHSRSALGWESSSAPSTVAGRTPAGNPPRRFDFFFVSSENSWSGQVTKFSCLKMSPTIAELVLRAERNLLLGWHRQHGRDRQHWGGRRSWRIDSRGGLGGRWSRRRRSRQHHRCAGRFYFDRAERHGLFVRENMQGDVSRRPREPGFAKWGRRVCGVEHLNFFLARTEVKFPIRFARQQSDDFAPLEPGAVWNILDVDRGFCLVLDANPSRESMRRNKQYPDGGDNPEPNSGHAKHCNTRCMKLLRRNPGAHTPGKRRNFMK
ncbi:hypothetical protein FRUB_01180 [Fimbriiglobus ruber]|uniref:Uncharacterized protein n=1 Tax=Fimbriiglobus ruber TaxID=1908690 RepID=A0A225E1P6_9BACT|nr:hypothetical protein FRUB_01180 [Fimbriiglobus ruber]